MLDARLRGHDDIFIYLILFPPDQVEDRLYCHSRASGNPEKWQILTFYETIKFNEKGDMQKSITP